MSDEEEVDMKGKDKYLPTGETDEELWMLWMPWIRCRFEPNLYKQVPVREKRSGT